MILLHTSFPGFGQSETAKYPLLWQHIGDVWTFQLQISAYYRCCPEILPVKINHQPLMNRQHRSGVGQSPDGSKLPVMDPQKADAVRTIFRLMATGNYTLDTLSEELFQRGLYFSIRTRR